MDDNDVERRVTAKVAWRFVPFLVLCYFVAYLDRVNVGFAKLTMDADIGITDTMFGFGAGVFFLAYFLLEVPSNLALDRVGARRWIARIMFSWGLISGAMAFIPAIAKATDFSGEHTFYFLRVLLGFAEAGFFPGIIFFLTLWFPAAYRARIIGYFMAAIPLSSALGSPVSASLLGLDGALGFKGWQWLFVAEAAPALVLAVVTYFYLTDRPADAHWLEAEEREWLVDRLAAEDKVRVHVSPASVLHSLYDPRVLAASLIYFGVVAALYGVGFWLPSIVKGFGVSIAAHRLDHRHPLRRRLRRHDPVGHEFRLEHGAHRPPLDRAGDRRDRHRRFGGAQRSAVEDGRADLRRLWRLRLAADLLDPADGDPLRRHRRGGHRGDQFDRQPLRLFRPVRHRLDQGRDRIVRLGPGGRRRLRRGGAGDRLGVGA